jgi:hypothetical protein
MSEDSVERTYVKVDPGWSVAIYDGEKLCFEPVIAWEIERHGGTRDVSYSKGGRKYRQEWSDVHVDPITIDGSMIDVNDWAVKRPDGTFTMFSAGDFATEEEVTAYLRAERQQREEAGAKRREKKEETMAKAIQED